MSNIANRDAWWDLRGALAEIGVPGLKLPEAGSGTQKQAEPVASPDRAAPEKVALIEQQRQAYLHMLGYDVGKLDGDTGPRTRQALKDFAKDMGIQVKESLGEEDISKIDQILHQKLAGTDLAHKLIEHTRDSLAKGIASKADIQGMQWLLKAGGGGEMEISLKRGFGLKMDGIPGDETKFAMERALGLPALAENRANSTAGTLKPEDGVRKLSLFLESSVGKIHEKYGQDNPKATAIYTEFVESLRKNPASVAGYTAALDKFEREYDEVLYPGVKAQTASGGKFASHPEAPGFMFRGGMRMLRSDAGEIRAEYGLDPKNPNSADQHYYERSKALRRYFDEAGWPQSHMITSKDNYKLKEGYYVNDHSYLTNPKWEGQKVMGFFGGYGEGARHYLTEKSLLDLVRDYRKKTFDPSQEGGPAKRNYDNWYMPGRDVHAYDISAIPDSQFNKLTIKELSKLNARDIEEMIIKTDSTFQDFLEKNAKQSPSRTSSLQSLGPGLAPS